MTSHVLLWSGGFDSTAMLLSMVTNPDRFGSVRVIGCGLKDTNNYEEDKTARRKIAEILDLDKKSNINYVEQELDIQCLCGIQQPIWAWLSAVNVGTADKVFMNYGFIRGDDFWHNRHEFENAVKYIAKLYTESDISFAYPLEWKTKKEFVSWYLHHPEVFRSLSWGGDTVTVKAKDREELEFLYEEMLKAKNEEATKHENKEAIYKTENSKENFLQTKEVDKTAESTNGQASNSEGTNTFGGAGI